jgi:ABC transporter substrate binding protein
MRLLLLILLLLIAELSIAKKCLYIASYHKGYEWSDGVERGLRKALQGKCEIKQFDMDTKRNPSEKFKKEAGLKARQLILTWNPDVVIASDDNASRYVIQPYFKNDTIPFVFCGINWNVEAYGYPYSNATGMVEVAPITELINKVSKIIGEPGTAYYLGVDVLTERKNFSRFEEESKLRNIKLTKGLAKTGKQWIEFYKQAQNYDFVIIGGNAGLNDWEKTRVIKILEKSTRKLSVTIQGWMVPYAMLGLTKIPEEQGEWAAKVAIYIMQGASPSEIPIVSNRKWDIWINEEIIKNTDIKIPNSLMRKAKKVVGYSKKKI